MKQHSFATLISLVVLGFAPGLAHAHRPAIELNTFCAESGDPAVGWTVVPIEPVAADHNNIQVEVSVDDGPWTLVGVGALTAANGWTFSGSAILPPGSLSVRGRVQSVGAWSNGQLTDGYTYAFHVPTEQMATDYAVPTNCEPPPPPPPPTNAGTGTPGYWKNHAEAWPVDSLLIGNTVYTQAQLIDILSTPTAGDVTIIMARAVISAELNGLVGNDLSCVEAVLDDGQAWLAANPIGSKVKAKSTAWTGGSVIATELDDYNNGLLCAPHRN